MALPSSLTDRQFQSFRQDLRGQPARRVVNVNDYYPMLALYLDKLHGSGSWTNKEVRFYDLTAGHFYDVLVSGSSVRVISVKQTAEGWIINPNDSLPVGDDFLVQENSDPLLQEDGSGILV